MKSIIVGGTLVALALVACSSAPMDDSGTSTEQLRPGVGTYHQYCPLHDGADGNPVCEVLDEPHLSTNETVAEQQLIAAGCTQPAVWKWGCITRRFAMCPLPTIPSPVYYWYLNHKSATAAGARNAKLHADACDHCLEMPKAGQTYVFWDRPVEYCLDNTPIGMKGGVSVPNTTCPGGCMDSHTPSPY